MADLPGSAERRRVEALQRWAGILDSAFRIPGTQIRFGLDALIGLVPGAGDAVAGLFSVAIVLQAARMHLPRIVIARMVLNSLLDLFVGAIPLVGDLFDVAWKANLRNVTLLDRHVREGRRTASGADYLFVTLVVVVLLAAAALPLLAVALLLTYLGRPLF
ncbi:MAG: DUF4112 domain-containing protein [Acidobacteria bacterium]|nr:MAG: DUF4112 domain-containing protein [Acidobacteriota bacterium]